MPSSVSISLVILVWITAIIIINHVGSANTSSTVAKPQSPPLAQEAKALNQTLWWWWWRNEETNPNLCKWDGIVCNDGGSVIEINLNSTEPYERFQLRNFSLSSFPNLVRFNLAGRGLTNIHDRSSVRATITTASFVETNIGARPRQHDQRHACTH